MNIPGLSSIHTARAQAAHPGPTAEQAETAASVIAGRLRIDISQARAIAARIPRDPDVGTLGWQARMMPLTELETLAAQTPHGTPAQTPNPSHSQNGNRP